MKRPAGAAVEHAQEQRIDEVVAAGARRRVPNVPLKIASSLHTMHVQQYQPMPLQPFLRKAFLDCKRDPSSCDKNFLELSKW
jgi:hypothetical protein